MGLIVLAVVSVVAFAAMRVSMNIIIKTFDKSKSDKTKKTIRYAMFIITPVLWMFIYFYPVQYGGPPKELNLWIMNWSLKTILYFLTPALVAVLVSMYLSSKND